MDSYLTNKSQRTKVYNFQKELVCGDQQDFVLGLIFFKLISPTSSAEMTNVWFRFKLFVEEISNGLNLICDALRDLVSSLQFKKREKRQRRSVTFSTLVKVTLFHGCFNPFFFLQILPPPRPFSHTPRH